MGKAVNIPKDEQEKMKELFKINQFNLMASDMIALNRSLPDVRLDGWVDLGDVQIHDDPLIRTRMLYQQISLTFTLILPSSWTLMCFILIIRWASDCSVEKLTSWLLLSVYVGKTLLASTSRLLTEMHTVMQHSCRRNSPNYHCEVILVIKRKHKDLTDVHTSIQCQKTSLIMGTASRGSTLGLTFEWERGCVYYRSRSTWALNENPRINSCETSALSLDAAGAHIHSLLLKTLSKWFMFKYSDVL